MAAIPGGQVAAIDSYCRRCRKSQPMIDLRPYRWGKKKPPVEPPGIGITGRCSACLKGKDFVVSERTYMALARDKKIWFDAPQKAAAPAKGIE
jgi:hypothetical protein